MVKFDHLNYNNKLSKYIFVNTGAGPKRIGKQKKMLQKVIEYTLYITIPKL